MALQVVVEYSRECLFWTGGPDGECFEPWYLMVGVNGWQTDLPMEDLNLWSFISLIGEVLHYLPQCA